MTQTIIQVMPAEKILDNMISVKMGQAPLKRYEVKTLVEAISSVSKEYNFYSNQKVNCQIKAICYGTKPRGWNKNRQILQKDFLV